MYSTSINQVSAQMSTFALVSFIILAVFALLQVVLLFKLLIMTDRVKNIDKNIETLVDLQKNKTPPTYRQ